MKMILSNSPAVLRGVIKKSTCVKWLVTKVTWFANGTILAAYCYQKHRRLLDLALWSICLRVIQISGGK